MGTDPGQTSRSRTGTRERFAEPDEATFLTVNRTRLRAWCWGDPASPPVLLVHGAHDHGRMWDDFAPRLVALGFRVVAIDVRGHGDSDRVGSGMMWNAATLDLCELARAIAPAPGVPVGMIGHSMGGGQVFSAAATVPERVAWVVNLDGLGPPAEVFEDVPPVQAATAALDRIEKVQRHPLRVWASREDMADRRGQINVRLPRRFLEHLVEHGTLEVEGGYVWKTDPLFNTGVPDGFSLEAITASFPHVKAPALALVSSEEDAWSEVHDAEAERRVRLLPDGRWSSVPRAGHYVHVEQPGFVIDAIRSFLADIGMLA